MTPETSEKSVVKQWLTLNGYFWYYNLAGLGCFPGVPDLTAIKDGVVIQIEVKTKRGKQSPRQKEFQQFWEKAGGLYICGTADEIIDFLCQKQKEKQFHKKN